MPGELARRVAIVTGAARGIGRASAEALLRAGASVCGCDLEAKTDLKSRRYRHRRVDVAEPGEVEAFIAETLQKLGRLDVLVNNAGTHPPTLPIDAFSVEDFDWLVRVNLRSVFVACRAALPALRRG